MKSLANLLLFVFTFVLGTLAGSFSFGSSDGQLIQLVPEVASERVPEYARTPDAVRVVYVGTDTHAGDEAPYLRFVVFNGRKEPLSYYAHTSTGAPAKLMMKGIELPRTFSCGTGMQRFEIAPGSIAEFHLNKWIFAERPPRGEISAGFYLRTGSSDKVEIFESQKFTLDEKFRSSLRPPLRQATEE